MSEEETDEKNDLVFHAWIPTLNNFFTLINRANEDPTNDAWHIFQPENVPVAKKNSGQKTTVSEKISPNFVEISIILT